MTGSVLDALTSLDKDLFRKLHEQITEEKFFHYLKKIADTHAPAQTAAWTRARVLEKMLEEDGYLAKGDFTFIRNFNKTGNSVVLLGNEETSKKNVWLLAHLDQITYLVQEDLGDRYALTPICYHLMDPGERAAVAITYDWGNKNYTVVDGGKIVTTDEKLISYVPGNNDVDIHPGMRVCFDSQLIWDRKTGEIKGSLDDAAGAVAIIFVARFLSDLDSGIKLMVGLTDEEEGVAGLGNQTICRGGARLLRYFDQPELVVASDIHEASEMYGGKGPSDLEIGDGASFAEISAKGLGSITPPNIYALIKRMAAEVAAEGIQLRENRGGYVSRTESVNAIYRTPNIALLGFLGKNRHFQSDVELANIRDLINLSKSIACLVLLTQTPLWQEVNL